MHYLLKSISAVANPGLITDIDVKSRTVTGYFSIFGNIDSDGDMIMPGAYTKTLQESGARARHLWQHDVRYPLARPETKQDNIGLWFKSVISNTSIGRDAIQLYQDGVIDEHSVGIIPVKKKKQPNYNEITEVHFIEGSSVTWGANQFAIGGMQKSMTPDDMVKRMDVVYKALRNGKYESDEIFELLDVYHQQLKQLVFDLSTTPAAEEAPEPVVKEENTEAINTLKSLTNLFKV